MIYIISYVRVYFQNYNILFERDVCVCVYATRYVTHARPWWGNYVFGTVNIGGMGYVFLYEFFGEIAIWKPFCFRIRDEETIKKKRKNNILLLLLLLCTIDVRILFCC